MSSHSTASDSPPAVPAPQEIPPGSTAASPGPSQADESQSLPWPYRDVDPWTGRLRPIPAEELQARYEDLRRRLAEIDAEDDTPEEVYDQIERNLDEERRRQGRPPAFGECC